MAAFHRGGDPKDNNKEVGSQVKARLAKWEVSRKMPLPWV